MRPSSCLQVRGIALDQRYIKLTYKHDGAWDSVDRQLSVALTIALTPHLDTPHMIFFQDD